MRIRYEWSSRHTKTLKAGNKHRTAFPKLAQEVIRISDVVLQVLDARFIEDTRNREAEEMVRNLGKKLVFVLNKADLVDMRKVQADLPTEVYPYVLFSASAGIGKQRLRRLIQIEVKRSGDKHKKAHVGVIGYPNTGKSTLINYLTGSGKVGTSQQSGFTKGIQRIRFSKDILILDTPGVFLPKENASSNLEDLKKHGVVGVQTYDKAKEPGFLVARIMKDKPGVLERFYSIQANGDSEILLEELGKKWKMVKKGGVVEEERAARRILKEWQEGKIRFK